MNCNLASSQLDNANLLTSIADVYGLQQLITDPTRCTESSSIFTNSAGRVVCSRGALISAEVIIFACMAFVNYP